jgi:hypothetical protein
LPSAWKEANVIAYCAPCLKFNICSFDFNHCRCTVTYRLMGMLFPFWCLFTTDLILWFNFFFFFCPLSQPDSVERFHISAFMLFVLAQNILEAEGPWLESFVFVSRLENLLVCHSWLEIADLNNFLLANLFYLDMAECSHGLHLWNGYWYHKTFIHWQIQWHKAYCILWIPWRPM